MNAPNITAMRQAAQQELIKLKTSEEVRYKKLFRFDIPLKIVCPPGEITSQPFDIPADADFKGFGLNLSYTLPDSGVNAAGIKISIPSSVGPLANDFVPLHLIGTPGQQVSGSNGTRYGYYPFEMYAPRTTQIDVQVNNRSTEEITVYVLFIGKKLSFISGEG